MEEIKVHLKLQSFAGEERRPYHLAECENVKKLDAEEEHVIWVYTFASNKEFKDFLDHDKVAMMLPPQYEGIAFTMVIMDEEDWDKMLLLYHDQ